jgi:phage antirepressor YoqD-like protein
MAHELKWGVGGGLGIILVGHLAKGVGLIGEERLIPFLREEQRSFSIP